MLTGPAAARRSRVRGPVLPGVGRPEDVTDRFQVLHSRALLRFEVSALGPFIPSVDGDDAAFGREQQGTIAGLLEGGTETIRVCCL